MTDWNYGDAYLRHPIAAGEMAVFADGSYLQPHDIFQPLPDFMRQADLLFVDPPWNTGNIRSFYTKAGMMDDQPTIAPFYERLFACIAEITPRTCYIEIGKDHLADIIIEMRRRYPVVTFYNATYYHRAGNLCYIVRGSQRHRKLPLDGMDEADAIAWIAANEDYACIGDLCMGLGLVALEARKAGRRFVGTELNPKRLSATLERLAQAGLFYGCVPVVPQMEATHG